MGVKFKTVLVNFCLSISSSFPLLFEKNVIIASCHVHILFQTTVCRTHSIAVNTCGSGMVSSVDLM